MATTQQQRDRRQRAAEQAVQATVARLRTTGEAALPMPLGSSSKLSVAELMEYRARHALHLERHPDYDSHWQRPTVETAEAVWKLVGRALRRVRLNDLATDDLTAKQALTVALDAAVLAGKRGAMLTTNLVFDTLASRWSDNYRAVRASTGATCSWQMKPSTVRASWRDLLRNGIRLEAVYDAVRRGCPGLYVTNRIPTRGYSVTLRDEDSRERLEYLPAYEQLILADPIYRRSNQFPRLLLANDELSPRSVAREVVGEWAYNIAEPGPRSVDLIRRLEATRLLVHVPSLVADVDALEARRDELDVQLWDEYKVDVTKSSLKPRGRNKRSARQWAMKHIKISAIPTIKDLVDEYDSINGQFLQVEEVREQLKALDAAGQSTDHCVEIKSGFYKLHNRRYQHVNFWAAEVTKEDVRQEMIAEAIAGGTVTIDENGRRWRELGSPAVWERSSRRGRWFRVAATGLEFEDRYVEQGFADDYAGPRRPLVGFDVSSSQVQILAVFCGLDALEKQLRQEHLKITLATQAWKRHHDPSDSFTLPKPKDGHVRGFDGPTDERLQKAVKKAVMTRLYGSEPKQIAHTLATSPWEYGPGLGDGANVDRLLAQSAVATILHTFLPACKAAAEIACDRAPYAGFMFVDPFDGVIQRWNPPRVRRDRVISAGTTILVQSPVGRPNAAGDYPVDREELKRMIAPCLTHTLDAMFAGFVVEQLNLRGVRDVVSVHDCWMVGSDAAPALYEAIEAAGEPWLRALGPIYDALEGYLGSDPVHGPRVRSWREQWERRCAAGNQWPKIQVKPEDLVALKVESRNDFLINS